MGRELPSIILLILLYVVGGFYAGLPFGFVIKMVGWSYAFLILESAGVVFLLLASYLLIKNYSDIANLAAKKQQ